MENVLLRANQLEVGDRFSTDEPNATDHVWNVVTRVSGRDKFLTTVKTTTGGFVLYGTDHVTVEYDPDQAFGK